MEVVIASVAMLSVAFVVARLIAGSFRSSAKRDGRMKMTLCALVSAVMLVMADMLVSGSGLSLDMAMLDLLPSAIALWIMSSSLQATNLMKYGIGLMLLFNVFIFIFHVMRMSSEVDQPSARSIVMIVSLMSASLLLFYLYGLFLQVRNVKSLMKNGTVWASVCMVVDIVYLCSIIVGVACMQSGLAGLGVLVLGGVISAAGLRIFSDSKFIFWHKQELLIIESMKLTSVSSASDTSHIEDVYKELYGRIVSYFEVRKPYLDSNLTINDLVKDLYSNKLYISKAISQFTGRNFCQFVNYYRVKHSMECFRNNLDLKIHELATMNGFNSVVSYSMAFRLFMGETPSEWCRKEKSRLIKRGK